VNPRRYLPSRWRQPPESTAEPVPLCRPYLDSTPPADWPPPRPLFVPQPRFTPRPEFIPPPRPIGDGPVPSARGSAASVPPPPPPTPWRPPAPERPRPQRAVIGDEIRIPILWCEFGQCIEWYAHADALGERDVRARALAAGWRYDALGRLACPACVQCDASFWAAWLPVPFQRSTGRPKSLRMTKFGGK
jgi:hypothetical protein